ncbi:phospholipase C type enzyme [Mortierella sp. NVP41]|nr:phospholipase C type enzyme [Mortierella sp. NVP41]
MTEPSDIHLSVLTLNCWGLVLPKDRPYRLRAIGQHLLEAATTTGRGYDIVGLQEVWVPEDYVVIREIVKDVLPYSKHWTSGLFGSGLATFSKYPIMSSSLNRFSLNGDPWPVWQGDWYDGKSCGSVIVSHPLVGEIEVFNTHVGDFNSPPRSLAIALLTRYGGFTDSWGSLHPLSPQDSSPRGLTPEQGVALLGITCDTPLNSWTSHSTWVNEISRDPIGERLDYIFYNASPEFQCLQSEVVLREKVPGLGGPKAPLSNLSDHYAVHSVFSIKFDPSSRIRPRLATLTSSVKDSDTHDMTQLLEQVESTLQQHLAWARSKSNRMMYIATPLVLLATLSLLVGFVWIDFEPRWTVLLATAGLSLLTVGWVGCFGYGFFYGGETVSAFVNVIQEVQLALENCRGGGGAGSAVVAAFKSQDPFLRDGRLEETRAQVMPEGGPVHLN